MIVGSPSDPDSEAFDDPEQLEHLEVVRRRLATWSALGRKLPVEILEEPRGRTNSSAARTHRWRGLSAPSGLAASRERTRSRNGAGTEVRSVRSEAAKAASCSAGVIASSSSAVYTLRATATTVAGVCHGQPTTSPTSGLPPTTGDTGRDEAVVSDAVDGHHPVSSLWTRGGGSPPRGDPCSRWWPLCQLLGAPARAVRGIGAIGCVRSCGMRRTGHS